MVARVLKLLLALQLLAVLGLWYVAAAVWHIRQLDVALLVALLILLLARALITVNNFTLSWYYRSATPDRFRLSAWQRCRLYAEELAATLISSSWTMAWPAPRLYLAPRPALQRDSAPHSAPHRDPHGAPDSDPHGDPDSVRARTLPVLLIHGYGCNGGYWAPLRRLLAQAGISHLAIDLEPITAPIDDYAGQVGQALELLCGHGAAAQAIIVAHSMGGLVARAYLRQHGAARIARVITLGTPHHGTGLAGFGIGSNTVQMRRSGRDAGAAASAWLDSLADMENAAQRALFTSIFSHHDNIVAPQTSAYFPGAKNLEFGAVGHVALGRSARILACVMEEIALASEAANADSGKPRQRG